MGSCLLNRVLARVTPGGSLIVLVVWTMAFVAVIAPPDQLMGHAQRIVYVHVAVAWFALMAFVVTAATAIASAWRRNSEWDAWSHAAAEVGWLSCSLTLITGSIWAHQAWGTWWTWDARLTTAFVLWLVYTAMLFVRSCGMSETRQARWSAALSAAGLVDLPLVVMATRWFRGMHPVAPEMEPMMRLVLLATVGSFAVFFSYLLMTRQRQLRSRPAASAACSVTSSQARCADLPVRTGVRSLERRDTGWPDGQRQQRAGNAIRPDKRVAAGSFR
jgi:heme exporter protein C